MKKVLYVSHGHPDFSPGGGELAALYLYEAMRSSKKYDPYFLARLDQSSMLHHGCWLALHDKDDRAHFIIQPVSGFDHFYETYIFKLPQVHYAFRDLLRALKPDIIHFQHYIHLGVDLFSYAKRLLPNAHIVATLHEYIAICQNQGLMVKTNTQALCHEASPAQCNRCFPERQPAEFFLRKRGYETEFSVVDKFLAPSNFLRQRYIEWGLDPEKIMFMENGRPPWPRAPRREAREGRPFVAGFFGQIVPMKGLQVFLGAAAEYLRARTADPSLPEIRFAVHGVKRSLPGDVEKQIEFLTLETDAVTVFRGPYQQRDMPELLRSVDCVVMPSIWWENSPLVIQEAFMGGVPVVCSNIGGMAEKVTDAVNGLHFRVGDRFDLSAKLLQLAGSPDLYSKLIDGIPGIYSDVEMKTEIERIYDEL